MVHRDLTAVPVSSLQPSSNFSRVFFGFQSSVFTGDYDSE